MENVKITVVNKGNTIAYVEVKEGRLVAKFTVTKKNGKTYLSKPGRVVESLKGKSLGGGKKHSGFVADAYISDPDFEKEILEKALQESLEPVT